MFYTMIMSAHTSLAADLCNIMSNGLAFVIAGADRSLFQSFTEKLIGFVNDEWRLRLPQLFCETYLCLEARHTYIAQ
jgi:hypothetical protein